MTRYDKMKDKKLKLRKDYRDQAKKDVLVDSWKKFTSKFNLEDRDKPLYEVHRTARELQALAFMENKDSLVILKEDVMEPRNYSDTVTGYVYLNFHKNDTNRFKKIVALHEASHLTLTPTPDQVSYEDTRFWEKYPRLVNLIEDTRMNRYLTIKYPGAVRYFKEEFEQTDSDFIGIAIGDLIQKEVQLGNDTNPVVVTMIQHQDEIRNCITFEDVLKVCRKIVQQTNQQPQQGKGETCDINGEGDGEDPQGCQTADEIEQRLAEMTNDADSREARLFDTEQKANQHDSNTDSSHLTIYKKDKEMFLGTEERPTVHRLSRNATKLLTPVPEGWRNTREGRLNKIDPIKLYNQGKLFRRRTITKKMPKAYIVLDGSGSMYSESRRWQKSLTQSLVKLFDDVGIDYKIFIHSGSSGEFYYSEIQKKDIPFTSNYCYTLDGSMLEALFEYEVDYSAKGIVFYFSDGQIPAQYPSVQVPLVEKYNRIAEMKNIPIFGIGIQATGVEMFKHFYVMQNEKDFPRILEQIGRKLQMYV